MSFLYPLFLIAGAALAIPVLIHLFNLRRYKTVFFPHTRFLKNIQLKSQKQSQLKYKWLLTLRMLFLAALILAFAQPFFKYGNKKAENGLNILFIDNSGSMSLKKGARNLLEHAKDAAVQQVRNSLPGSKFMVVTNDKAISYQPITADKAISEIRAVEISSSTETFDNVLAGVQNLLQTEDAGDAALYYYADFQRNIFANIPDAKQTKGLKVYAVPVQAETSANVYIDTAYFNSPVLQTGQSNTLIVRSRLVGKAPADMPVLQLSINGQTKSAASLDFNDKNERVDTLSFVVNDSRWQQIMLAINDASVRFDDTFRITARSVPNLSVLVFNEAQPNPYIQAAFRAYNGFQLKQVTTLPEDLKEYNLIVLNGITHMDEATAQRVNDALQTGQSVCIFPGRSSNYAALNTGLKLLGDISIGGLDTATQAAASLQQGNSLVKDLFENIPENVQLPIATWHYVINAGLSANQQSVLSFRNGDPFLAAYTPGKGSLYIAATGADMQSGNFPGSYFFAPFLYQMAMQSRGGDVYALTAGSAQPAYLPMKDVSERNIVHMYGDGLDIIPPQRPAGAGLDVFATQAVQQPGFYTLAAANADTTSIALNANRQESQLDVWDLNTLKKQWKGDNITWLDTTSASSYNSANTMGNFPLWKVCAILAVLMVLAETAVLAGSFRKQNVATQ